MSVLSTASKAARIEQIEAFIAQEEAAGRPWSGRTIYRAIGGSHGFITTYLQTRRSRQPQPVPVATLPEPLTEADDDPVFHPPAVVPTPPDPVATAEQAVRETELELDIARENMDQAVLALWLSRGLIIETLRYGGYAEGDPARTLGANLANTSLPSVGR